MKRILWNLTTFFILIVPLCSRAVSQGNGMFSLRYPSDVNMGEIKFTLWSGPFLSENEDVTGRIFRMGAIAGISGKLEAGFSVSYDAISGSSGWEEGTILNRFPFFRGGDAKGFSCLSLLWKYILAVNEKSMLSLSGELEIPLTGKERGVTTSKIRPGLYLIYLNKIFRNTVFVINSGLIKNFDSEETELSDEFVYALGLRSQPGKRLFWWIQASGIAYIEKTSTVKDKGLSVIAGAGYEFGNGIGVSLGVNSFMPGRGGGTFSEAGIIGSIWFSPGNRRPLCKKIASISIGGPGEVVEGTSVEYFAGFFPKSASGPVNYEWKCSDNGNIVYGKWSPLVTVEWKKGVGRSFLEVEVSNGCSVVRKRVNVTVMKN